MKIRYKINKLNSSRLKNISFVTIFAIFLTTSVLILNSSALAQSNTTTSLKLDNQNQTTFNSKSVGKLQSSCPPNCISGPPPCPPNCPPPKCTQSDIRYCPPPGGLVRSP